MTPLQMQDAASFVSGECVKSTWRLGKNSQEEFKPGNNFQLGEALRALFSQWFEVQDGLERSQVVVVNQYET